MKQIIDDRSSESALGNFKASLGAVKPHMFTLMDKLIQAAPEASWGVMICDDVGGRLPAFFTRKVLANAGYPVPIVYVAGSKHRHEQFGDKAYDDYFQNTFKRLGMSSLSNVLLFTEVTSHGTSLSFLSDRLAPFTANVDSAAIVNKYPELAATTYYGAQGSKAAQRVYASFEAPSAVSVLGNAEQFVRRHAPAAVVRFAASRAKRIAEPQRDALLGIGVSDDAIVPVTASMSRVNKRREAYDLMLDLVTDYCTTRLTVPEKVPVISEFDELLRMRISA